MIREDSVRLWISAAVAVVMALAMAAWVRWLGFAPRPSVDSDLDMPSLFSAEAADWENVPEWGRNRGVPVLCYHFFRPGVTTGRVARVLGAVLLNMPTVPDNDFWTTTVPEFDRQMRWLHENGYRTIFLDELADWMDGGESPGKAVAITVDDGDRSFVTHGVPVLRRYDFRATLFMLTGRAGETGWNDLDFVDWAELRALEREGVVRVESHTHRMHRKHKVAGRPVPRFLLEARDASGRIAEDSRLVHDLRASRATIRREMGHETGFLAWPFGFGDAAVDSVALSLGFRRVLTLRPERNLPDFDGEGKDESPWTLGRYAITARTSLRMFRLMVERDAEESPEAQTVLLHDPW